MKIHQNWGIYRSSTGISFVAVFNHIVWGWQVTTSSPRCWLVDCQSWFRRQALSAMWCSPLVGGPMGSFFCHFRLRKSTEIPPEMDDSWGENPQGIQGWSWKANAKRKKQHLKRRQRLELDLSEALGRYFTFHDVTQLTPELHAGDRLQAIRYAAGKLWTNLSIPARWCPLMFVGFCSPIQLDYIINPSVKL